MPEGWYEAQREKRGASFVIPLDEVLRARFGPSALTVSGDEDLDPANAALLATCTRLVARDGQTARWIHMNPPEIRTGYETTPEKRLSAVVCLFRIMADKPGRECKVLTYMSVKESGRFGKSKPSSNPGRTWLTLPLADLSGVLPEILESATRSFLRRSPQYSEK
jgi:hypothetical protein